MEFVYAFRLEFLAKLYGGAGGNQLACLRVVIQPVETAHQRSGDGRPAHIGKFPHLFEIGHRQNSGHQRHIDAVAPGPVAKAQETIRLKEKTA